MLFRTSDFSPAILGKWAFALAAPACIMAFTPRGGELTVPMIAFLAVTCWAACAWALNLINEIAVALLLPVLFMLCCGVEQRTVYAPWLSDVPIIVVGGFILGKIIQDTGLGRRIALRCMRATGGSVTGALCGITLAAVVVAPLVPSIMGKTAIFCAVAVSLCEALDFAPKSREATAVVLGTCLAVGSTKLAYLTGGADLVMGMGLVDRVLGTQTSWMEYARFNFVPAMLYTAMSLGIIIVALRASADKDRLRAAVKTAYDGLGPMTDEQRRAAVLLCVTLLLLATDRLHGLSAGAALVIIAVGAFLPGIGLMDAKRIHGVNFAPLFFIVGCMSIGSAGGSLGVTRWLADQVLPMFGDAGAVAASTGAYVMGVAMNFILTPLPAMSTLSAPIAELGVQMGLDPKLLYFSFQYGLDNLIFPYEYPVYLYFFSSGYIDFKRMALVMGIRMVLAAGFVAFVAVPYWRLMG
ncbi:MAG: anion permease [Desulfovibrio sp.]|nr:anion permease [Desulfovibrio sp.]